MMLQQSLPPAEKRSPLVVALLSDLFARQLWDQLQAHSDPDVINQYIVLYGQVAAAQGAPDERAACRARGAMATRACARAI